MVSMGRSSDDPGAPEQPQKRLDWRCMGWFVENRKTGCQNRLLEQGPAVSALLRPDWVVCLPSLDLPSNALTLRLVHVWGP